MCSLPKSRTCTGRPLQYTVKRSGWKVAARTALSEYLYSKCFVSLCVWCSVPMLLGKLSATVSATASPSRNCDRPTSSACAFAANHGLGLGGMGFPRAAGRLVVSPRFGAIKEAIHAAVCSSDWNGGTKLEPPKCDGKCPRCLNGDVDTARQQTAEDDKPLYTRLTAGT